MLNIQKRIKEIKILEGAIKRTGVSAYKIGMHLQEILKHKLYRELEYTRFSDFCQEQLSYTRQTAHNYIRIYTCFTEQQVRNVPLFHLIVLARPGITKEQRARLLTEAGSMDSYQVAAKAREATGNGAQVKRRSPFRSLVGESLRGKRQKDQAIIWLDDHVRMELKLYKTKVVATFRPVSTLVGACSG